MQSKFVQLKIILKFVDKKVIIMIIKKFYRTRTDGINLYQTYSDKGLQIHKIGTDEIYDEAIDVENAPYRYEETDIKIDNMWTPETFGGE